MSKSIKPALPKLIESDEFHEHVADVLRRRREAFPHSMTSDEGTSEEASVTGARITDLRIENTRETEIGYRINVRGSFDESLMGSNPGGSHFTRDQMGTFSGCIDVTAKPFAFTEEEDEILATVDDVVLISEIDWRVTG